MNVRSKDDMTKWIRVICRGGGEASEKKGLREDERGSRRWRHKPLGKGVSI